MNPNYEILSKVLRQRYDDVCRQLESLNSSDEFTRQVQESLRAPSFTFSNYAVSHVWTVSDSDWLTVLQSLALNQHVDGWPGAAESETEFLDALKSSGRNAKARFNLLVSRYSYPLNFTLPTEQAIREHVLERLMVQDRAAIEDDSVEAIDADDLLLRLNLIAVTAATTPDLRFLDALNYYYELLPEKWCPTSQHRWLMTSFLVLYARALSLSR